MKNLIKIALILLISIPCFGQIDTIVDSRDKKVYRIAKLDGKNWMIDNLDYETENSIKLDSVKSTSSKIKGRYYPFYEKDTICPKGWSLPTSQDWTDYFQFVYDSLGLESKIRGNKKGRPAFVHMYVKSEQLDLFIRNNPIKLKPNFFIEGGELTETTRSAHYWTKNKEEEFKNKSHTHFEKNSLIVHSHKEHMQRKRPDKLRMFMIRCVCENKENYR